jgi:hypothetical protein
MSLTARAGWSRSFDEDPSVIYAIDRQFRLIRCNKAWDRFALENGGHELVRAAQLGPDVLSVIPPALRSFYMDAFDYVLQTGRDWLHAYECSSAKLFRRFQMRILAQPEGWLLIHSLECSRNHVEEAFAPRLDRYAAGGEITMCSHCRRTKRIREPFGWDWVPAFVEKQPEKVSHGLCNACLAYYYPTIEQATVV